MWLMGLVWDIAQATQESLVSPRCRDLPGCCGPSLSSWNICSKARNDRGLHSFVHIKCCHLAPGNLPSAALARVQPATPAGRSERHSMGKRGSELPGGGEAVWEAAAARRSCFAFCGALCLIVLRFVRSTVDWGFNK